ncbi:hypothetical protein GCM10022223_26240 [Kineosporia mesophila]|uniref:Uncharacterized protein n=1 Tax=Kineosporia mesophila TaxID=566012 RepID=A0ABP6ZGE3_9ACTN
MLLGQFDGDVAPAEVSLREAVQQDGGGAVTAYGHVQVHSFGTLDPVVVETRNLCHADQGGWGESATNQ